MFYAARGSIPPKRHTQHRAPDGSLYAEELFGVEGFTGRSRRCSTTSSRRRGRTGSSRSRDDPSRGGRRRLSPPPPDRRGRRRAARRRDHRPDPAVLQQRHRDGRRPPGRGDARDRLLPQRRGRRAAVRPRGQRACSTPSSGRSATAPATTSSCRSGRPGGSCRTTGATQRMLYPRMPVGDRAAEALPQRLRPAARALARTRSATSGCPTRSRLGPTRASSGSTSRCATG